jgi:hypothetical protein
MMEFCLNIYMSGMKQLFSDIVRKVFHFGFGVVSSTLGTTTPPEQYEMASFFADACPELSRAHETGRDTDFNALIRKVTPKLQAYAGKLALACPLGAVDLNDYVQEGIIIVWRNLSRYRFICPLCNAKFQRLDSFKDHGESDHGEAIEPTVSLARWLDYSIKRYMKNHLRSMRRSERKAEDFFPMDFTVGDYTENTSLIRPDVAMFSRLAVERLEELASIESNPKVQMLVKGCLQGTERPTIWKEMAASGLAKTPKSAAVCVNRLMKRRDVWRPYRVALA